MAGSQITFSQKVLQDLAQHELYTSNLQSSRLMQHKDGILYIWSELKKCLYTKLFHGITNERAQSVENESTRFQVIRVIYVISGSINVVLICVIFLM